MFSFGLAPAPKKRVQFCHAQTLLVCCLREPTTDTAGNARRFDFSLVPVRFLFFIFFSVLILFGVLERKRQKRTGRGDRGRQEKFAFMIISGCFGSHI